MRNLALACCMLVLCFATADSVSAQVVRNTSACAKDDAAVPTRQTVVLVDGAIMANVGPTPDQLPFWRSQLARFVNAGSSEAAVMMAPSEYVSIGTLKPDGTGVNVFFEGCIPLLSREEIADRTKNETGLTWFLGNGWEKKYEKDIEDFFKSAASSAVLASRDLPIEEGTELGPISESLMMLSLRNYSGANKDLGIPRIVIITDLQRYDFPQGDQTALINAGNLDGQNRGAQLGYAELHVVSENSPNSRNAFDYLSAFFLASQAKLETLATGGGALTNVAAPISVKVFHGAIVMRRDPELAVPVKLRIAWDRNFTVVNSWMEETQGKTRYSPFGGSLKCDNDDACEFVGDGIFAQVWTANRGGEQECLTANDRFPFGGFRDLSMVLRNGAITGLVADETCFFSGMEDGLTFTLQELEGGRL